MTILAVGFRARGSVGRCASRRTHRASRSCGRSAASRTTSRPTLGSAFQLTYPRYEILLLRRVGERSDRAPRAAPDRRASACSGAAARRRRTHQHQSEAEQHRERMGAATPRWIVMADSNVLMPPDYLERLLDTGTGYGPHCHRQPIGCAPGNVWAELECAFLNTYQARWQLAADARPGLCTRQDDAVAPRDPGSRGRHSGARLEAGRGCRLSPSSCASLVCACAADTSPFPQPLGHRTLGGGMEAPVALGAAAAAFVRALFLSEFSQAASCRFASPLSWPRSARCRLGSPSPSRRSGTGRKRCSRRPSAGRSRRGRFRSGSRAT